MNETCKGLIIQMIAEVKLDKERSYIEDYYCHLELIFHCIMKNRKIDTAL
jgi:hypothetical protein